MSPSDQNSARENPALSIEYYYKQNDCPASSASAADCICWHAPGTGRQRAQAVPFQLEKAADRIT